MNTQTFLRKTFFQRMSDTENHFTSDYDSDDSGSNYSLSSPISLSEDDLEHEVVRLPKEEKPESSKMAVERAQKSTDICNICGENYTQHKRKPLECHSCNFTACQQCVRTQTTYQQSNKIRCMNPECKNEFPTEQLREFFPKGYFRKIDDISENNLLREQLDWNPQTMEFLELYKRNEHLLNQNLSENKELKELRERIKVIKQNIHYREQEIRENNRQIQQAIITQPLQAQSVVITQQEGSKKEIRFIKCSHDSCKGFVNSKSICIVCDKKTCIKCHKKINEDEEHTCNKEDLDSVKFIENKCKPCPNCKRPVQKNGGCNQVYCFLCKTAFNFNTGEEDKSGHIHAPDYRFFNHHETDPNFHELNGFVAQDQIQRLINQEQQINLEDDCYLVRTVDLNNIIRVISLDIKYYLNIGEKQTLQDYFRYFWRKVLHITRVELQGENLPQNKDFEFKNNLKKRMEWISGKVSDNQFKKYLLQQKRIKEYLVDVREIFQTFVDTAREMVLNICRHRKISYLLEFQDFHEYMIEEMNKLSMIHFNKTSHKFVKEYDGYKVRLTTNEYFERIPVTISLNFHTTLKKMVEKE